MTDSPTEHYDVVIVGGGINGAGVAQAVAAAGHSVLLLEKSDLAAGTSHASSKLIHGGLRYLESFEFDLVYEALRERAMMLRNAPELVKLKKFFIPVYENTRRGPWLIRAGLTLYSLCDMLRPSSRFRSVPKKEWGDLDGIRTDSLKAVFQYQDAQTDDRLLTQAVMDSAIALGAELKTDALFISASIDAANTDSINNETKHSNQQGKPLNIVFRHQEQNHSCSTRVLINATGPWVNHVAEHISPLPKTLSIDLIQGTHIIIDAKVSEHFFYVESPSDGRAVFVMPWYQHTMIGTTEARFKGNPDDIQALDTSVRYLLKVFRHYFPEHGSTAKVVDSFAGARVLPTASNSAFKRSRETILYWEPSFNPQGAAICTIYGGKLTAWRATAEKVMKTIKPALAASAHSTTPPTLPKADTKTIKLFKPVKPGDQQI